MNGFFFLLDRDLVHRQRIMRTLLTQFAMHCYYVYDGLCSRDEYKLCIFTARKRSLRQGNIFTCVCHSVQWRGVSVTDTPSPGTVKEHSYGNAFLHITSNAHHFPWPIMYIDTLISIE